MKRIDFVKEVEKKISPIDTGTIHFMETYAKLMPISLQNKMINSGPDKNAYMGFVVEPYSFFLAYKITNLELAKKLIPDNYRMIKTKIYADDEPDYYAIFGTFNVHTSAFYGTRMEFYIIAENKDTGLLSWVIVDYDTNTVSHDEMRGLFAGNTKECVFTTTCRGEVFIDIKNQENGHELVVDCLLEPSIEVDIDQRLWLEGNLSVTYGCELSKNEGKPFAVIFDEAEVKSAMKIDPSQVNIEVNNWYSELIAKTPSRVCYFRYAQHFLADSPGHYTEIKNDTELAKIYNELDFASMPPYSSKGIKKAFVIGQVVSTLVIIMLILILIIK